MIWPSVLSMMLAALSVGCGARVVMDHEDESAPPLEGLECPASHDGACEEWFCDTHQGPTQGPVDGFQYGSNCYPGQTCVRGEDDKYACKKLGDDAP